MTVYVLRSSTAGAPPDPPEFDRQKKIIDETDSFDMLSTWLWVTPLAAPL